MPTKILLTMPQPGETISEGNIVRWLVKPGDLIKEKQPITELETEKAVFEYESPCEGKLLEIVAPDGSTIPVGEPIAVIEVDDAKAENYLLLGIGKKVEPPSPQPSPTRGEGVSMQVPSPSTPKGAPVGVGEGQGEGEKRLSPLIRRLLREHNIPESDLGKIKATGAGGRITKEDLLSYLGQEKPSVRAGRDVELIPCSPIRLRIAEHMIQSKRTIPHAHTGLTIDMTKLVEYRAKVRKDFEAKHKIPLGILPLLFPALKKAIEAYPMVNASFREAEKAIAMHKKINLGVAVDTERGLYIPVLTNAQDKGMIDFSRDLEGLLERARKNKLTLTDLTGMTFTFNNYGYYGTTIGVQIILPPQSSTLGMGRIEARPWVVDGKLVVRQVADFMMAFDHRVMDGRDAGLFLSLLKKSIENFSEAVVTP